MALAPVGSASLDDYIAKQNAAINAAKNANATQNGSATGLGGNFQTFLKILTTQLTHQDPLAATDTNQFTQQLVQFANVEQQINANSSLTKLINLQTTNALSNSIGYIGKYVAAGSPDGSFALQGGKGGVGFDLESAAGNVTIKIKDANGVVVNTFAGSGVTGTNYAFWDGKDAGGEQLADGLYTFEVTAKDSSGTNIPVINPKAVAKVTSVQISDEGGLKLVCNGLLVSDQNIAAVFTQESLPGGQNI